MNKNIYKIYSGIPQRKPEEREENYDPLEDRTKKSYNQISGLKLSGNHQYIINYDGKELYLANSGYVALLEKRLREQLKEIRELQSKVARLEKIVDKQKSKINEIILGNNRENFFSL